MAVGGGDGLLVEGPRGFVVFELIVGAREVVGLDGDQQRVVQLAAEFEGEFQLVDGAARIPGEGVEPREIAETQALSTSVVHLACDVD